MSVFAQTLRSLDTPFLAVKPVARIPGVYCGTSRGVRNVGDVVFRDWKDWRAARDTILFFAGLAGVAHEVVFTSLDRPGLLVLFAGMMGLAGIGRSNGH